MVCYHASDGFSNSDGNGRLSYYGISGVPTSIFDGTDWVVGANPNTWTTFRTKYNQHILVNTPGVLSLKVDYNPSTRYGSIAARFKSIDQITQGSLRLRYALTESHKYYPWQWLDSLQFILRDMLPGYGGISFSINQGETFENTQSFYVNSAWVDYKCELVVWVQSDAGWLVLISNLIPLYQTHVSGDANGDKKVTVSDAVWLTNYVFYGGPQPHPSASGDPNEDCVTDIEDIAYIIKYLFEDGPAPLRGWEID